MDGKESENETLSLVIKTPNQFYGDQLIEDVNTNWTVKELKTHLARVYPSKPTEKDQRLIYSGKLLPDLLYLRDVFRKTDVVPTLHLVCACRPQLGSQQGSKPKVKAAEQPCQAQQSMNNATTAPSGLNVPSPAGLRQRGHNAFTTPAAESPTTSTDTGTPTLGAAPMTHPAFPTYSLYSPQQLLWLQHMYARQYYMQYQAAMAAAASSPVTSAPIATQQASVPAALPNQAPIDNLPANQNVPNPDFINPEGANQNLRMNAQGGPVLEDDEDVARDWLDWVYTASRFAVFLSFIYFYSNLSRFVLVMSSLFLMYLHTAGWFQFRNRAQAQPPNQPAAEVLQDQEDQNQEDQNQEDQDQEDQDQDRQLEVEPTADAEREEEVGIQSNMTAVPVSQVQPNIVWTAWVFFKAFFASLIPEAPGAVAN